MSEIKDLNYISIHGWMRNHLDLSNAELMTYALIYGFSQTTGQYCTVSYDYIAEWAGITRRGAIKSVKALVEKKLVIKQLGTDEKGVSFCRYIALVPKFNGELSSPEVVNSVHQGGELSSSEVVNSVHRGGELSSSGVVNSVPVGSELSSPNNIYNNISNNNNIYIGDKSPVTPAPENKKRFVKPTVDEIAAYISEKGYTISAEKFFNYYESNGWKVGKNPMKNWKSAVSNWQNSDYNNNNKVCGGNNTKSYEGNW